VDNARENIEPIVVTTYNCAICKQGFPTMDNAVMCAKAHRKPLKIVGVEYAKKCAYPDTLVVQHSSGITVRYTRSEQIVVLLNKEEKLNK